MCMPILHYEKPNTIHLDLKILSFSETLVLILMKFSNILHLKYVIESKFTHMIHYPYK